VVSRSDYGRREVETYQTLLASLSKNGYIQDSKQPFRFFRTVEMPGDFDAMIEVDLMAGEYGGTGKGRRTQPIQDARARKARGCDLAFLKPVMVTIKGRRPGGGRDSAVVRVAGIVPFMVMKGMALFERMKEKDAYDIVYCIEHFPGGLEAMAEEFGVLARNRLVQEGLGKIRSKFATIEHVGPKWVAEFLEIDDKEERAIVIRRAYEKTARLLDLLGIQEWRK